MGRQKAIDAGAIIIDGEPPIMPEPQPRAALPSATSPKPEPEPALEGVVLDAATARKRARDEAYRSTPKAAMFRAVSGS